MKYYDSDDNLSDKESEIYNYEILSEDENLNYDNNNIINDKNENKINNIEILNNSNIFEDDDSDQEFPTKKKRIIIIKN